MIILYFRHVIDFSGFLPELGNDSDNPDIHFNYIVLKMFSLYSGEFSGENNCNE